MASKGYPGPPSFLGVATGTQKRKVATGTQKRKVWNSWMEHQQLLLFERGGPCSACSSLLFVPALCTMTLLFAL